MTTLVEVEGWAGALEKLVAGLASRFLAKAPPATRSPLSLEATRPNR
jgi:hypothetical protein